MVVQCGMDAAGPPPDPTPLLQAVAAGDGHAAESLLPIVYAQLRAAAHRQMSGEPGAGAGHTLSATALVHEAYVKLVGPREVPWAGRGHFYAAAAEAMRRILIDRARSRRGRAGAEAGAAAAAALRVAGDAPQTAESNPDGFLALDEALLRLEGVDAGAAAVVRLRFFAGLGIEETAAALGVSARTVKRDWAFARGWLREDLEAAGVEGRKSGVRSQKSEVRGQSEPNHERS